MAGHGGGPRVPTARGQTRPLRVLVVCDQYLTSEAVRVALHRHEFELLAVGSPHHGVRARQAARVVSEMDPDVGLLVQEMLDPLHVRDALAILRAVPDLSWLLLTGSPRGPVWGAGLSAGADAVLPMSIGLAQLADALRRVHAGEQLMDPEVSADVIEEWEHRSAAHRSVTERLERLTPREMEVLRALANGHSVTEIAEAGGVNVATVRSQVKAVLRKLEVRSQLAAVAVLQRAGIPYLRAHHTWR